MIGQGPVSTLELVGIWASIIAAVFAVLAVVIPLVLRWWDGRARLNIRYYLGDDPPGEWLVELGSHRLQSSPVLIVRVENVGARTELLTDAYLAVRGADDLYPFGSEGSPAATELPPGFPSLYHRSLRGICRALVDRGCTGTVRGHIVVRLGRATLRKKRIKITDVEAKAEGRR